MALRPLPGAPVGARRVRAPRRPTPWAALAWLPRRSAYAAAAAVGRHRFRQGADSVHGASEPLLGELLDATAADVRLWARRAFENASCDQLEYELLARLTRRRLPRYLELRGLEHRDAALADGHGAVLYSGHVRGHCLLFSALGLLGYRPNVVGMPIDPDTPRSRRLALERRDVVLREHGCRFLNMAGEDFAVAARAANALRRNEVVTFEIDPTHSGRNLDAVFLGRPARFPAGPLRSARAAGAPQLHYWLHRPERRTPLVAEIVEPTHVSDDLGRSLAALLAPLEASVRRYPESWATWCFPEQHLWRPTA